MKTNVLLSYLELIRDRELTRDEREAIDEAINRVIILDLIIKEHRTGLR